MKDFFKIIPHSKIVEMGGELLEERRSENLRILAFIIIPAACISIYSFQMQLSEYLQGILPLALLVCFPKIITTMRLSKEYFARRQSEGK